MAKKSVAQIKRMMKRAEARGDVYEPPEEPEPSEEPASEEKTEEKEDSTNETKEQTEKETKSPAMSAKDQERVKVAKNLEMDLQKIEDDTELKSKDRRSAIRKAHAIASEASGMSCEELLEWYATHKPAETKKKEATEVAEFVPGPYIVFVGQLSYDTTKEGLFAHFKNELAEEHEVKEETLWIRLLTDPKTKRSRGMAFIEVSDPELLYACLKLHHSQLDGRRLNVERSVGGGRESRKSKLKEIRKDQEDHMGGVVDTMLAEYKKKGDIREDELDNGVILLCKRYSPTVVQAALETYIESNGRDMDNPSAYLTFLVGKLATEGIFDKPEKRKPEKRERPQKHDNRDRDGDRDRSDDKRFKQTSEFAKKGIDMSLSKPDSKDLATIFPSYSSRGRGRG
jgi:RNA recognition motif-containing protein